MKANYSMFDDGAGCFFAIISQFLIPFFCKKILVLLFIQTMNSGYDYNSTYQLYFACLEV